MHALASNVTKVRTVWVVSVWRTHVYQNGASRERFVPTAAAYRTLVLGLSASLGKSVTLCWVLPSASMPIHQKRSYLRRVRSPRSRRRTHPGPMVMTGCSCRCLRLHRERAISCQRTPGPKSLPRLKAGDAMRCPRSAPAMWASGSYSWYGALDIGVIPDGVIFFSLLHPVHDLHFPYVFKSM